MRAPGTVSLLLLVFLPSPILAQAVAGVSHYLDVPGVLPDAPQIDPTPTPPVIEVPEADSVAFVIDRSCSMRAPAPVAGIPGVSSLWDAAKYELGRAIEGLDPETTFGVILFNHAYVTWHIDLVEASEANRIAAMSWVGSHSATGGTTYTDPVVAAIDLGGGPPEVIEFLSDGIPNEGMAAVASITAANAGRSIINTIAFSVGGTALTIMQGIANQNGGQCTTSP